MKKTGVSAYGRLAFCGHGSTGRDLRTIHNEVPDALARAEPGRGSMKSDGRSAKDGGAHELHREATGVARLVSGALLAANRAEADGDWSTKAILETRVSQMGTGDIRSRL